MTPVVVDASVAVPAAVAGGLKFPGDWRYLAPGLLWSEVTSALHEAAWRGELSVDEAERALRSFAALPLERDEPDELRAEAWRIADELGLAKTYDAEFLALARLRGCRCVTADARLRRGAGRLGFVVDPVELSALP